MWWRLSLLLTLCPGVWHWLCDVVGTMGWAEAARTHFRGNPLCVKCWCCLQHDSVLQQLRGWPLRRLLTQWSSVPGDSGVAPSTLHSFLTRGKMLGRAHVAVRCVPPAPGAYPNLLNLAVLGGSREDTETAVQPPWGAWILTSLAVCSKAEQQPASCLAQCSLSRTPDSRQALQHLHPIRTDWPHPGKDTLQRKIQQKDPKPARNPGWVLARELGVKIGLSKRSLKACSTWWRGSSPWAPSLLWPKGLSSYQEEQHSMQNAGGKWAKQGVEAFTSFNVKLVPKPSSCESWGSAQSPQQRVRGPCPAINGSEEWTCASWEGKGGIHGWETLGGKLEMGETCLVGMVLLGRGRKSRWRLSLFLSFSRFPGDVGACRVVWQRWVVEEGRSCSRHFMW